MSADTHPVDDTLTMQVSSADPQPDSLGTFADSSREEPLISRRPLFSGEPPHRGARTRLVAVARSLVRRGRRILYVVVFAGAVIAAAVLVLLRVLSGRDGKRFMTTTRLSVMDRQLQRACRCIERNCSDPDLDVSWVCQTIVTGEAYLEALFQRELGMSVGDFIGQVRVNRVRVLLGTTPELTDDELAVRTGCGSAQHLRELFRSVAEVELERWRSSHNPRRRTPE